MGLEQWKTIEGFPDYRVSDFGRVYSIKTGKYLKGFYTNRGYLCVKLFKYVAPKGRKPKTQPVHRLVAKAFLPEDESKPFVTHITGNKQDCSVWNLERTTKSESFDHMKTAVLVVETGEKYDSINAAAQATGAYPGNVSRCLVMPERTTKGYHFKRVT